jgi:hypothetical protein
MPTGNADLLNFLKATRRYAMARSTTSRRIVIGSDG